MADLKFEDSTEVPTGRRGSDVPEALLTALADSAKRGVAKSHVTDETGVKALRKLLASARVREHYEVVTARKVLDDGRHRLTFKACRKTPEPASK